jgi:hypothetical protein
MARRRRRYSGFGSLDLSDSISLSDAAIGIAAGTLGALGLSALVNKFLPSVAVKLAPYKNLLPAITGVGVGAALYYGQGQSPKAKGQAIAAAVAGAAVAGLSYVSSALAGAGYAPMAGFGAPAVALNLSNYAGLLVNNPVQQRMNGLIVDNNANLGALGAASMGGDDEMGYADIVALRS